MPSAWAKHGTARVFHSPSPPPPPSLSHSLSLSLSRPRAQNLMYTHVLKTEDYIITSLSAEACLMPIMEAPEACEHGKNMMFHLREDVHHKLSSRIGLLWPERNLRRNNVCDGSPPILTSRHEKQCILWIIARPWNRFTVANTKQRKNEIVHLITTNPPLRNPLHKLPSLWPWATRSRSSSVPSVLINLHRERIERVSSKIRIAPLSVKEDCVRVDPSLLPPPPPYPPYCTLTAAPLLSWWSNPKHHMLSWKDFSWSIGLASATSQPRNRRSNRQNWF